VRPRWTSFFVAIVCVVGAGASATACAGTEYDRDAIEQDLRDDSGLSASQAHCLTRRLEDSIRVSRLGARDDPTSGERDKLHGALVFAIVACSGAPYDRDAVAPDLAETANLGRARADCLLASIETDVPPVELEASDNLDRERVQEVRAAIVDATLACGGRAREVRRNAGLTRKEAECVLADESFEACTTSTTTTSTTTGPATSSPSTAG
jgi:hypothetical protein